MPTSSTPQKARRRKGEGTFRHLDGDRYQVIVTIDGQRVSRTFHASNRTEANRTADDVRTAIRQDFENRPQGKDAEREERRTWTVERYSKHYLETWAPYHLEATTRARYSSIHTLQVVPNIGHLRMAEVTPSDLTAMYAKLALPGAGARKGKLSGLTILTVHMVVRALFTFACKVEEDFDKNPAEQKSAQPKVDRTSRKPRALDVADVERFVALVEEKAPAIAVPVMLSAYLGTRRGETVALRWSDVDYKTGTLLVRRAATWTKEDGLNVKTTKNGKERTIPLDPHTVSRLKAIESQQKRDRMRLGKAWEGAKTHADDYIAATSTGALWRPTEFGASFRTFCKQQSMTHITPHVLRHAFVSQMIALGFDAVTIAAMTGHSPDVLLKTYAHAFDKRKREAMNTLGDERRKAREAVAG